MEKKKEYAIEKNNNKQTYTIKTDLYLIFNNAWLDRLKKKTKLYQQAKSIRARPNLELPPAPPAH